MSDAQWTKAAMHSATAWSGDWEARIRQCLTSLGYGSMRAFFHAHPGAPFGKLFQMVRNVNASDQPAIAYVQFQAVYYREAELGGWLREAMADTLARKIREHLPSGWNCGRNVVERRANVISSWELPLSADSDSRKIANRVWTALKSSQPPDNWCPVDGSDPLIQRAFAEAWPDR